MQRAEAWLDFDGVVVQLGDVDTVEEARARLQEHTDIAGLLGMTSGHNFSFRPAANGAQGLADGE